LWSVLSERKGTEMAERALVARKASLVDKRLIQRIVAETNRQTGFVPDPTATAEKAQEMMWALGINPEDNLFSSGIIAACDEE
jgi:hypothetical protein